MPEDPAPACRKFFTKLETTLFKSFLEEKKITSELLKKCIYVVINAVGKPSKAMYIMYRKVGGLLRHSPLICRIVHICSRSCPIPAPIYQDAALLGLRI